LFEFLSHHLWLIINSEDDFFDTDLGQCLDLMAEYGLVSEVNERLGDT
jgi:hypothetical protein